MPRQQTAFIFDMDGTLVDNMAFHMQAWQNFLSSLGMEMTEAEVCQQTHGTIEQGIRRICGEELSDAAVATLANKKESLYRELYKPHIQPITGLREFLQVAQSLEITMALGTSAMKPNIDLVLDGLDIAAYFTTCIGGDDVTLGKPHPETFLTVAQQLDIAPRYCVVFEDSMIGIEAAQNAGMRAVALTTSAPASTFTGQSTVEYIIQDYSALNPRQLL
ncbi:haloacid dehalogenase superfamily protein, subfamily IA, variant 3 with third motif having DD or ED/beta-phosphoglucomutase family hydrolase [Leptolyngbya sp. PCC 7375]|nr:haloacid dehalogenase superfamily protein, subfamily IA, variant 3 with third motif having DD or ED/beta-phosphoglucomutase family hydrolase [Leptolyngbya sp. PCC 7375]